MSVPWSCREQVVGYLQRRPDKAWELRRSGTEEMPAATFVDSGTCLKKVPAAEGHRSCQTRDSASHNAHLHGGYRRGSVRLACQARLATE